MRQVKITDLPQADNLTGNELTVVVQSGVSKKASIEQIVNNASGTSQHWAEVAEAAANTASGFANQTNADAQAAAASAAASQDAVSQAEGFAQDADYSATVAYNQSVIATNQAVIATAQATTATTQAGLAQAASTSAQSSANSAADDANLAYHWANKLDGPVAGGEFSAHYWANQAASAGGSTVKVFPAGENLGGHRLVILRNGKLFYADTTDSLDLGLVVGMTVTSASTGQDTQVQFLGDLTEGSWSWTIGSPVYFDASGVPTQTQPSSGFSQIIGFASTATKIYIQLREPIALS